MEALAPTLCLLEVLFFLGRGLDFFAVDLDVVDFDDFFPVADVAGFGVDIAALAAEASAAAVVADGVDFGVG